MISWWREKGNQEAARLSLLPTFAFWVSILRALDRNFLTGDLHYIPDILSLGSTEDGMNLSEGAKDMFPTHCLKSLNLAD